MTPKEQKIMQKWHDMGISQTDIHSSKPKHYVLDMFPYPSGEGLHVGHWRGYVLSDVYARQKKMEGYEVLHPMGWDAFGLPAENHAIKTGQHPADSTKKSIDKMRTQVHDIGKIIDWKYELATYNPDYYKWTQWLFLQLYENGLAYKKEAPVNYCPSCNTVLANEQVIEGACELCDTPVVRKNMNQWFFKITDFADELIEDLDTINWPEKVKAMQKNWIGRSYGTTIHFPLASDNQTHIEVFTTRADTIAGATYMVLAPEHSLVDQVTTAEQKENVDEYVQSALHKSDLDREAQKEKNGVFTGGYAINPYTEKEIPIWVGDYVLASYGSGAVMAVPAHDERDYEFAKKYKLPITPVIDNIPKSDNDELTEVLAKYENDLHLLYQTDWHSFFANKGSVINSGEINKKSSDEAIKYIQNWLSERKLGGKKVQYKLRDWLVSRQRYWGCPIPVVYCDTCGIVPIPENDLPVQHPRDIDFTHGSGNPLGQSESFVNTTCPKCHGKARRETDTMDTFVDSSWYYLRYPNVGSQTASKEPFSKEITNKWLPVDQYVGGIEHAVMHLLYARFFVKALYKLGFINFKEPFKSLFNQGMIYRLGKKMSKSKGNGISPDDIVPKYGTDAVRAYELFIGPPAEDTEWSDQGFEGVARFLERFKRITPGQKTSDELVSFTHQTLINYERDFQNFHYNTLVSHIMKWTNMALEHEVAKEEYQMILKILAPICPFTAEELWATHIDTSGQSSVFTNGWPEGDPEKAQKQSFELVVQITGKVRDRMQAKTGINQDEAYDLALSSDKIQKQLEGEEIKKVVYIQDKLINIVI